MLTRKSGFGIFNSREISGYGSGWCSHCGRRRGTDGRCNDCDPWFTSPLVQYGGPIVAMFTIFLIIGAIVVKGRGTQTAEGAGMGGAVLAAPVFTSLPLNAPTYRPAPITAFPAMPKPPDPASLVAGFAPSGFSPEQQEYQNLESLRQMTAYVDSQVSAARLRREQEETQPLSNLRRMRAVESVESSELGPGNFSAM